MPTLTLRRGDVLRYRPESRHCREGMAIVREDGRVTDTYWTTGGEHLPTRAELDTATLVFNLNDFRALEPWEEHKFVDFHPDDRAVLTHQHGLVRRLHVRIGTVQDREIVIENARAKVAAAESEHAHAASRLSYAHEDLARLLAEQTG